MNDKVKSGFYDKLVAEGRISSQDLQPNIEPFIFYRDAFLELCTCKHSNEAPIPFTSIIEYFKIYGEEEDFDDFLYVIRVMDNSMLDELSKKRERENAANRNKKNPNKGGYPRG